MRYTMPFVAVLVVAFHAGCGLHRMERTHDVSPERFRGLYEIPITFAHRDRYAGRMWGYHYIDHYRWGHRSWPDYVGSSRVAVDRMPADFPSHAQRHFDEPLSAQERGEFDRAYRAVYGFDYYASKGGNDSQQPGDQ